MPERRLRRFLHLERPRAPRGEGAAEAAPRAGRFEAVRPGPAAGPAPELRPEPALDRFGPPPLELAEADGRRPFVRCVRCGMDANAAATACDGCGADLGAPAQREFDRRFWAEREAEAAREARASAERRAEAERAAAEEARARRAMGEALAREVGERERRRLEAEGLGGAPRGLRVPRALAGRRWLLAAGVAAAAAALALLAG